MQEGKTTNNYNDLLKFWIVKEMRTKCARKSMHKCNKICQIWHAIFSRQSPDGPWRTSVNTDSKKKSVAACMRMGRLLWGNSFIFFFLLISVWHRPSRPSRPSPAMEGRGERYAFQCQRGKTVPALRIRRFWKLRWRTAGRVCKRKPPDTFAGWLGWQDGREQGADANSFADREPSKNRSMAGNPWGAVYHGRHYAVDQEVRKYSASLVFDTSVWTCGQAGSGSIR